MTAITQIVRVHDASEVSVARRAGTECARTLGFSDVTAGKVALIATELATNLLKHGDGGSILFGADDRSGRSATVVAIDKGRGIRDLRAAMADGYSTAGSPGTGLGAVQRTASFCDVYTLPDRGSAVLTRIEEEVFPKPVLSAAPRLSVAGICLPKPPEEHPGDAWAASSMPDTTTVIVADGLGHGPAAATASSAAMRIFEERSEQPLERILQDAHGGLRPTRGAAVAVARIDLSAGRVDFAGVGNIAGSIVTDNGLRRMVSLNGIVGHEMRKVQTFSYPWEATAAMVLHSDGLSTSWASSSYPGLMQRDPLLIAAVLYRDYVRGTDDATVVVVKAS